ncbi:MAG: 23S rRNA (pseudouridine(1915)-N(3))-methyltransferase RlmH [Lachnospirales bacterium]
MAIKIYCVGKIKDDYITKGIEHFTKNENITIIEIDDEKAPEKLSEKEIENIKNIEGDKLLCKIPSDEFLVALAIDGKEFSDIDLKNLKVTTENLSFVIGGSLGLSKKILSRANLKISFGKMTYTHQHMRLILAQCLYN